MSARVTAWLNAVHRHIEGRESGSRIVTVNYDDALENLLKSIGVSRGEVVLLNTAPKTHSDSNSFLVGTFDGRVLWDIHAKDSGDTTVRTPERVLAGLRNCPLLVINNSWECVELLKSCGSVIEAARPALVVRTTSAGLASDLAWRGGLPMSALTVAAADLVSSWLDKSLQLFEMVEQLGYGIILAGAPDLEKPTRVFSRLRDALHRGLANERIEMALLPRERGGGLSTPKMRTRHALVVAPTLPTFRQGNSVRMQVIQQLLEHEGYIQHLIYYLHDGCEEPYWSLAKQSIDFFHTVSIETPGVGELKYSSDGKIPLKNAHLIDDWCGNELREVVRRYCEAWQFDLCIVNYVWLSAVLEDVGKETLKVIDTHDRFGLRDDLAKESGVGHSGWFACSFEQERRGLLRADRIWAVQESDADYFRDLGGEKVDVAVIGHYMEAEFLPQYSSSADEPLIVGYLASGNPWNIRSIKDFYDAWSAVPGLVMGAELRIAGSVCDPLGVDEPQMVPCLLGRVESEKAFYSDCDVIVNPMFGGTGLKIKCVETLAFGKPLVATRDSMKGIPTNSRFHLTDTYVEMATLLEEVVADRALLRALAIESRKAFTSYYKPGRLREAIEKEERREAHIVNG